MWVAVTSPGTEIDAAEHGIGALGLTFNDFAEQERRVKVYRKIIANCEPAGAVNDQVATVNFLYCHEDNAVGQSAEKAGIRQMHHRRCIDDDHIELGAQPSDERFHARRVQELRDVVGARAAREQRNPGDASLEHELIQRQRFQLCVGKQHIADAARIR